MYVGRKRCICITLKVNLSINPSMVGFYHPLFLFLSKLTTMGTLNMHACVQRVGYNIAYIYGHTIRTIAPPSSVFQMDYGVSLELTLVTRLVGDIFKLQAIRDKNVTELLIILQILEMLENCIQCEKCQTQLNPVRPSQTQVHQGRAPSQMISKA